MRSTRWRPTIRPHLRKPIFIVGVNRTGKSLFHSALSRHPRIFSPLGAHDTPMIGFVGGLVERVYGDPDHSLYVDATTRVNRARVYDSLRRLCLDATAGPRPAFVSSIKKVLQAGPGSLFAQYWCAETFPDELEARGLQRLFPGARFVWMLRNAVDAIQARKDALTARGKSAPFRTLCERWTSSVHRYRYLTLDAAGTLVRFEDLAAQPRDVFQRMSTFLELGHSEAPAMFVEQKLSRPDPDGANRSDGKGEAYDSSAIYELWTEEQRKIFLDSCGEAMTEAGYVLPR